MPLSGILSAASTECISYPLFDAPAGSTTFLYASHIIYPEEVAEDLLQDKLLLPPNIESIVL